MMSIKTLAGAAQFVRNDNAPGMQVGVKMNEDALFMVSLLVRRHTLTINMKYSAKKKWPREKKTCS